MPLQLGTWTVNLNGTEGPLVISAVSPQGEVTGTIFGETIEGLWDEVSQSISFVRQRPQIELAGVVVPPPMTIPHFFKGFLFSTPPQPPPGQDVVWTLAGSVISTHGEAEAGISATTFRRNEFGWFARITQVM